MRLWAVVSTIAVCVGSAAMQGQAANGGVGDALKDPPPASSKASTSGTIRVAGGVVAGRILTKVPPVYPPEARAASIGGTVVLHAIIGKDGTIQKLTVVSGPDMLQKAAVDAVRQWVYEPYLLNGVATEVDTTIMVNFNLNMPKQEPPPDM